MIRRNSAGHAIMQFVGRHEVQLEPLLRTCATFVQENEFAQAIRIVRRVCFIENIGLTVYEKRRLLKAVWEMMLHVVRQQRKQYVKETETFARFFTADSKKYMPSNYHMLVVAEQGVRNQEMVMNSIWFFVKALIKGKRPISSHTLVELEQALQYKSQR